MNINLTADVSGQTTLNNRDKRVAQAQNAAQEFEAFFLSYVFKQMYNSTLEDGLFGKGFGGETFSEMFSDELAKVISQGPGVGLSQQLFSAIGPTEAARKNAAPEKITALNFKSDKPANPIAAAPTTSNGLFNVAGIELRADANGLKQLLPAGTTNNAALLKPVPFAAAKEADKTTPALRPPLTPDDITAEKTEFIKPLDLGLKTSGYGFRHHPISGQRHFHGGIDFAAPRGSEIKAAAAGRVIFAGIQGGYGNTIVIEHSNGYRTRYAHADSLNARAGDAVEAGQIIGQVGSTGRSTGPHLHFEVIRDGQKVNPADIFSPLSKK